MRRQRSNPMAWTGLPPTRRAMRAGPRCAHDAAAREIARFDDDHRGTRARLRELA